MFELLFPVRFLPLFETTVRDSCVSAATKKTGFAFVTFEDEQSTRRAMREEVRFLVSSNSERSLF